MTPPPTALALYATREERLERIKLMGQRVDGYVKFMCHAAKLPNISGEALDRAVAAFCAKLADLESELASIHDAFRLE